jgi:ATP-dependent DNA helicase RecG
MVEIYDNRVEITNPGGLPKALKAKDFGKKSVCRNSIIASLLLRAEYIERMGTGINRIKEAIKAANCSEPEFDYDTFFTLTFPRPATAKTTQETSEKTSEKILKLLKINKNYTISELSKKVGVTTRSIERSLYNLQKSGKVKRLGPEGGHWEVL